MKKILLFLSLMIVATLQAGNVKVLFIGDSITDGAWGRSGGNAQPSKERNHWDMNHIYGHSYMFLCASHYQGKYPEAGYEFFNRGISANTLGDLEKRWEEDVIDIRPDVLSILIGTNDVNESLGAGEFDIRAWETRYRKLLDRTLGANPDTKLVLCTPFVAPTGRLKASADYPLRETRLAKCVEVIKRLADDYNACLVPFHTLFHKLLEKHPIDEGRYWIWDGIHPTPAGHQRMADLWMQKTRKTFKRINK